MKTTTKMMMAFKKNQTTAVVTTFPCKKSWNRPLSMLGTRSEQLKEPPKESRFLESQPLWVRKPNILLLQRRSLSSRGTNPKALSRMTTNTTFLSKPVSVPVNASVILSSTLSLNHSSILLKVEMLLPSILTCLQMYQHRRSCQITRTGFKSQ